MAAIAPSSDKAADLLQNLSLDSESKTIGVAEPAKKTGPVFSNCAAKGSAKPFNPNSRFVPNGYPSTAYYYGGYDGQGDWNVYSRYMNLDGGMAQGVYGDNCSYMYHQGYGYTPYGTYAPPNSSSSILQQDGQHYGLQQYQYPCSYYKSPASSDVSYTPNKISVPQGEISTPIDADRVASSNVLNKGNTVNMANSDFTNKNGLKPFSTSSQHTSLNANDSYQGTSWPAYAPFTGYQGPRISTHGAQLPVPSDMSLVSDSQSKKGAKVGLSSSMPVKSFTSQRNQRIPQPLPQFANLNGSRHPSGFELVSGFMNGMYPSNRMYNQYGSTFRANSRFGSAAYGSRIGSANNRLNATGDGYGFNHFKRNMDGFSELNKGPRAAKSYDNKNIKSLGPVTLLLKGQNLPVKSDTEEVPIIPNKEHYNGKDFSESYSDAKFFVIKSYSEDDIHKSIKYNVWASTPNGNKKLDAAYQETKEKSGGCPLFLLFSVNTSGQFVGLAEMLGPVDFGKSVDFWQQDRWTGCFSVKWHVIKDIPNSVLRHITLENNENKPVTNSRDTQEVKFEKGVQIVKIFKEYSSQTCILDDFEFYETREKATQEKKSKEQQLPKKVSNPGDLTIGTVTLPKSLLHESAAASAAEGRMNVDGLLEGNGSTTALEDSSKSC
ncbi:YTH domain-containing protein ECT4 isoform X1 [Cajanus cajan]|uniref:YTH domain-containing family protein n=1 Tax=Cajanus cajan TaxID=3821 RepID=A0A151T9T0_CAJCA|nr:YTH domain-containing protein ECT4 isoform X1 [Cajanus cajan]KYP63786.1 YTH domain family protein 2 [Cajanus cajan]